MKSYSQENLDQAVITISSLKYKCEKSLEKVTNRIAQQTLLKNRISALKIALELIQKEIDS